MGGIVGDIISFIGRPFGIYTHKETFTDLKVQNLLTPGVTDPGGRKGSRRVSGGDAATYFAGYQQFKKQYRKKYTSGFLRSVGYEPNSTAVTYAIQPSLLASWLTSAFGLSGVVVISAADKYTSFQDRLNYAKQSVDGYDPNTGKVLYNGKYYDYFSGVDTSPTRVDMVFKRYYVDTIVSNLIANYSYNSTNNTIKIGTTTYSLGPIEDNAVDGLYSTEAYYNDTTVVVTTAVDQINRDYSNGLFDNQVTFAEYTATSLGVGVRYLMVSARSLPIYSKQTVDITAIIPMKEDNVIVDLGNNNLVKLLDKLNLSGDMLKANLQNGDIDSAYLMTAIDPLVNDQQHNMVMFQMFDLMGAGGSVSVSISKLSMTYSFGLSKSVVNGVIGPVGTYSRSYQGNIEPSVMTLRYQGSATQYRIITVTDFVQTYVISGISTVTSFDSNDGTCRLLIPLAIYNRLKYEDWVHIYERSLCFMAFAVQVVEVQWYETGAFSSLLKIAAIALAIFSVVSGNLSFTQVLINFALTVGAMYVIQAIAIAIGGELGMVFAFVAAVIAMYYGGGLDTTSWSSWLQAASSGLNTMNQVVQHEVGKVIAQGEAYMADMKAKMKDLEEKMEKYEDNGIMLHNGVIDSIGSPNRIFDTIEGYVSSIVNTEWLVDGAWMYDIDSQIAKRKSVYVGV